MTCANTVLEKSYPTDDFSNIPSSILSRVAASPVLPYSHPHPLSLLRQHIESHFHFFTPIEAPLPVVTPDENFSDLGFPPDHPGRSPTDTYYLNRGHCLRTHTSAHEVSTFAKGFEKWLLTADVYRRDEIDSSHYPIFHQMEGAAIWSLDQFAPGGEVERECIELETRLANAAIHTEDDVDVGEAGGWQTSHMADEKRKAAAALSLRHLKASLNNLVLDLFGDRHAADLNANFESTGDAKSAADDHKLHEPLRVRWIPASFPFTTPSFEIEVWFRGRWLEILGCGVVMDKTLENAELSGKVGWAFGLGLERIAMILYSIPDIRLFWSKDPRFLTQFADAYGEIQGAVNATEYSSRQRSPTATRSPLITFRPYSRFPPCYKDISFWLPQNDTPTSSKFHDNDFMEIVRDESTELVEDVRLIDDFIHPKTGRKSKCYRINYRSMDRNLENEEVNQLHSRITQRLVENLGITIR